MNTTFWGPSGWLFLHSICNIYPEKPTNADKLLIRDFMLLVNDVLPCKYCRASFTKYSKSLNIIEYCDSNEKIQEWMYKIHNKVNGKLRRQGFCHIENPSFESVLQKYNTLIKKYHTESGNGYNYDIVNYICELGLDFLGSIIFNYQGYFVNCHTGDEKVKIISVYHKFFNIIIPVIKQFTKLSDSNKNKTKTKIKIKTKTKKLKSINGIPGKSKRCKFNIRFLLQQNEPYTKLKMWFYNCSDFSVNKHFKTYEDYESHFNKHIVSTCNTPIRNNIKSCRKLLVKHTKTDKHTKIDKHTKNNIL